MIIPWVVTTSDKYIRLMPEFALRFNEYIGFYKVDVLCFEKPDKLPPNFNVISMGKQSDFGDKFTDPMIPYFESFKGKFFFHILEDYYVNNYMNHDLLKEIFVYCAENKIKLSKIDLSSFMMKYKHKVINDNIVELDQNIKYRTSLQASLWSIDYWRKLLVPDRNPWQFEKRANRKCKNDGAFIVTTTKPILTYYNASHKGKMKVARITQLKALQDKKELITNATNCSHYQVDIDDDKII